MDAITALTEINLDDLVDAFGWQDYPALSKPLRRVFRGPARKFATEIVEYDRRVGELGLSQGAKNTLFTYVRDVQVAGRDQIPAGPLLVLSNHPGMADSLALFAALRRDDVSIVALDRPFLKSLPNTSNHLDFISEDPSQRMAVVRRAVGHLRSGGCVLTYPSGKIEPDPDVLPGAVAALDGWSASVALFARMAPDAMVLPTLVRGVLWDKAVLHPLTRLKRDQFEREKLGAAIQLLMQVLFNVRPVTVRVQFAVPFRTRDMEGASAREIHQTVIERMARMIEFPAEEWISIIH